MTPYFCTWSNLAEIVVGIDEKVFKLMGLKVKVRSARKLLKLDLNANLRILSYCSRELREELITFSENGLGSHVRVAETFAVEADVEDHLIV